MTRGGRSSAPPVPPVPLPLERLLRGARLIVLGGTGFLGKVWWTLLLHRYPDLGKLYLVVRARPGQSAEERFWNDIAKNECLDPLRQVHGDRFESFLREKIEVLDGDIVKPFCGLSTALRDRLRGRIDAVVNASGIVDFQPPLDLALEVNAFGVQSLVQLARDLGNAPILHTSTCYVAGYKTGIVEEKNPLEHPFPRAGTLERVHWDPDREIAECLDIIEQAKHRASDAFRESHFLAQAKQNLLDASEPARGAVLEAEIERVRRQFVERQLAEFGQERAQFWGWPNTYTYTKSIGEQIVAKANLPFAIVRPAIVESCVEFPVVGWNEGINTSAPLIFAIREGQQQFPGAAIRLDLIPCDMVATGMLLALAELLDGTHRPVYQFGTSDSNPTTMARIYELAGLYKRKYYQRTGRGGPLVNFLQMHSEGALMPAKSFERIGPRAMSKGAKTLATWLEKTPKGPVATMINPTVKSLHKFSRTQAKIADIIGQFIPFTAQLDYEFRCDNTRAAWQRLTPEERSRLYWSPETIDWRDWFLRVHAPGLERWVFPHLERKLRKPLRSLKRHETLVSLLQEMADRYDLAVALQRTEPDGLSRISYRQWCARAKAIAAHLRSLGVGKGDHVALVASNHPNWPIAFFGILFAGATVVPLDAQIDPLTAETLLDTCGARAVLFDAAAGARLGSVVSRRTGWLLDEVALQEIEQRGANGVATQVAERDPAVLIYTSGTTESPKGVVLSHCNLTSLLASLAPLFPLQATDRILSVLPLHHTFELTCGMLLPLSRGCRIVYLDELTSERLEHALRQGRITAMIGVPALWEMLERRILAEVKKRGGMFPQFFDLALQFNRLLGTNLGLDAGRLLFGPVHRALGGHLKYLVSGGAALGPKTHQLFAGLGLHLAEGYGLTEAGPVLSVAAAGPRSKPGHVGSPIPDVELKVDRPNAEGVGEILARGPNVMKGYLDNPSATEEALDGEGWLRTGDLGKLDHRGRLSIVGRQKDVIIGSNGENVYPDDVEARLGLPAGATELSVFGIRDERRGERGGETVACVAVAEPQRIDAVKEQLRAAIERLPPKLRPAILEVRSEALPRTPSRKVKRQELQDWLSQWRAAQRIVADRPLQSVVRTVLAAATRREVNSLDTEQTLRGDLGCDSLILLELLTELERSVGHRLDAEQFSRLETVGDVEQWLQTVKNTGTTPIDPDTIQTRSETLEVPEPLRAAAMTWLGKAQHQLYGGFFQTKVTGRAFIPKNKNVVVVANHASHLDFGLVKYALGEYGARLAALAAQDYFFEGRMQKAFFENFTNLVPISRTTTPREALETARSLLEQGRVVLLFPEGTRSRDGALGEFKPLVGSLVLQAGVDLLPLWLEGTFEALPKGSGVLRSRKLGARIGPVLSIEALRAHTGDLSASDAARRVASLARTAVLELSRHRVFELGATPAPAEQTNGVDADSKENGLSPVFDELRRRWSEGITQAPVAYYLSLGEQRFTLRVSREACTIEPGRTVENADCVVKTTEDMFRRIVLEGYTPKPAEFLSGKIKSNNIPALKEFQKMFNLKNPPPADRSGRSRGASRGPVP